MLRAISLAIAITGLTAVVSGAADVGRHSGRVVEVGEGGRSLVIEEMGPWMGPNTGLSRRTVVVAPGTSVRLVVPTGKWEENASPGYDLKQIAVDQIKPGDFVTVAMGRERSTINALEVVRADGADAGLASPSASPGRTSP